MAAHVFSSNLSTALSPFSSALVLPHLSQPLPLPALFYLSMTKADDFNETKADDITQDFAEGARSQRAQWIKHTAESRQLSPCLAGTVIHHVSVVSSCDIRQGAWRADSGDKGMRFLECRTEGASGLGAGCLCLYVG